MKRKISIILSMILTLSLVLTACGGGEGSTSNVPEDGLGLEEWAMSIASPLTEEDQKIWENIEESSSNPDKVVVRLAAVNPNFNDSATIRGDRQFLIELKKRLEDKVEIQLYTGASLGGTADQLLGGLQNKNFELASYNVGAVAEYSKAFMPLDVMFLIKDLDHALRVIDGKPMEIMNKRFTEDTGLKCLVNGAIGMRHITNSKHPITKVDDIKGLKIRVQNNPLHLLAFNALGAGSTPIAYSELFTSLQQKVVDGQENPITNIYSQNYIEVQDYFTYSNHLYTAGALICNNEWLESQSDEFRKAIEESAEIAQAYSGPELKKTEKMTMDRLIERGLEVNELSEEEYAKFKEISMSTWDEASEIIGKDYFEEVKAEIEKLE